MNKDQLEKTYDSVKTLTIKDSISLVQALKELFKELLIPEECLSIKAEKETQVKLSTKDLEKECEDELVR